MGSLQANEVIKVLTGIGETLSGRMMLFDALTAQFDELPLMKNSSCPACGVQKHADNRGDFAPDIAWYEVTPGAYLVDVREPVEISAQPLPGAHVWPLTAWQAHTAASIMEAAEGSEIVVVCASGRRSREAADALVRAGARAASVSGGISSRGLLKDAPSGDDKHGDA